jgi:hypothetical protein
VRAAFGDLPVVEHEDTSAARMVERRCAIPVVRPRITDSRARCAIRSLSVSSAGVASSSTSTLGSLRITSGDPQALALAAGEAVAALADDGAVALVELGDPVVEVGAPGRLLDLGVAGAGLP